MQDTEETNRQAKRKAAIEYGMQRVIMTVDGVYNKVHADLSCLKRAPALSAEILTGVANSSSPPSPV